MKKLTAGIITCFLLTTLATSCTPPQTFERGEVMELYQIAYNSISRFYESQDDITVYIKEDGEWEPFLVLEASYPGSGNGGTLLLRKYLLPQRVPWFIIEHWREAAQRLSMIHYQISYIDQWLNTAYLHRFTPEMQARILLTNIAVESEDSTINHRRTTTVPRQIFLLSLEEVGGVSRNLRPNIIEGKRLDYFIPGRWFQDAGVRADIRRERLKTTTRGADRDDIKYPYYSKEFGLQRGSTFGGGVSSRSFNWWLRSGRQGHGGDLIYLVMDFGMVQTRQNSDINLVRPAFTLPKDTPIVLYEIEPGRLVYVIHQ